MEFLVYTMCAVVVFLILFQPKRERLAFWILCGSFGIAAGMFLIAVTSSLVPTVTL
ncbi:MAG TPA: hypothetical protein VK096_02705 [Actinomycetales bacterium]|nr:hypothetical protein [Actinomycetales bacterium]